MMSSEDADAVGVADATPPPPPAAPPLNPPPPLYSSLVLDDPTPAPTTTSSSEIAPAASPLAAPVEPTPPPATTPATPPGIEPPTSSSALGGGGGGGIAPAILVTDPVKVGDGVGAYARYAVVSRGFSDAASSTSASTSTTGTPTPTPSNPTPTTHSVTRRFSDFTRLRDRLVATYPGVVLYPLPEKTVTTAAFHPEFLRQRAAGLTLFMSKLATNPIAAPSDELRAFLSTQEMPEDAEAAWYNRGATGTALSAAGGWWNQLTAATEAAVAGAKVETLLAEEDPKYLAATEYLLTIEERLKKLCAASDAVIASACHVGAAAATFGERATRLGECEEKGAKVLLGAEAGGLGQAFTQVGGAAASLKAPTDASARSLADAFREPLKRALELTRVAKETIDLRSDALMRLTTAKKRATEKRALHEAKLREPPPPPPAPPSNGFFGVLSAVTAKLSNATTSTVEELKAEADAAEAALVEADERFEGMKTRMRTELPRLHADLEREINDAFTAAGETLSEMARANADAWERVMPGCSDVAS